MNDRECSPMSSLGTLPPWRAPLWRYLCLAALLASPLPAFAELALMAAAITHYEYNSNVFDLPKPLPPGFALPVGTAASNYGDSFVAYGGKLDASYLWSQQQFFATIQGNEFHYDRFTGLNHSEYTLDGGWDWKVGRLWDGVLDVTRIRSMVSFLNLIGTSLVVQTEQRETGRASLQITPDWRTEFTGITRKVDQPQPDAPNLSLSESSGEALIKYVGTAGLTSGLMATYLKGAFSGIPSASASNIAAPAVVAPSYTQSSAGLTATDDVTGLSTFRGQIGYTRRSSDSGVNNVSALTGELAYKRTLTGKTSAALDLSRLINVYLTNTATEIDNVAALTVDWQATYKIDVVLVYNFNYRELPGQGNVPLGSERVDRLNLVGLSATYEPVPWVILKPYVHYQEGASRNYIGPGGNFNSSVVGLQFTLQWQQGVIPPRTLLNY